MTGEPCDVAIDPVGVAVDVVCGFEPALSRAVVEQATLGVAAGRAKRRRLAGALRQRPEVVGDGRSPAPRVVGELLIALRAAGAVGVSPPVCAGCGKALGSLERRGQDWYCSGCGARPEPCAACGHRRRVTTRDRDGRPRCGRCPDADGGDAVAAIAAHVAALDAAVEAEVVAAAVRQAAPRPAAQRQLAWAVAADPELLTGGGHRAPLPAVLRLIDALADAAVAAVVRPACPRCERTVRLAKQLDGQRVCRSCRAKAKTEPCARCGASREPAARDDDGGAVCSNCLVGEASNLERCVGCGRRRRVNTRTAGGPQCVSCPPLAVVACSICAQQAPCGRSRLTGQPWCVTCQHRSARCAGCGRLEPIRSGTLERPRCEACTVAAVRLDCPTCGDARRPGRCGDCRLERRLVELLGDVDGAAPSTLEPLRQALVATRRPQTVLGWLAKERVATLLGDLAAGREVSHQQLDALPASPTLAHLRSVLVATGVLPARDEQLVALEALLSELVASRADTEQRWLLHRYAVWHLLRRLRWRNRGAEVTRQQSAMVRQRVRAAAALLDWLTACNLTLASCRQADLDRWLATSTTSHRQQVAGFVRWAAKQGLCDLLAPALRWQGPTRALDDQARWQAAHRLVHDDTVNTRDRLAGLLVLLYAQHTAAITRLTTDDVDTDGATVRLRLGPTPVTLPDPVAELARQVLATERGHATIGAGEPSPWLFPGGKPGRPLNASYLGQRLKALGIQPGQARSTALFQLAGELPAAVLARMLGVHISVAVAWQHASSGDWTRYAADVARRTPQHAEP